MNFINNPKPKNRWLKAIVFITCIVVAIKFDPNNLGGIADAARTVLPLAIEVMNQLDEAGASEDQVTDVAPDALPTRGAGGNVVNAQKRITVRIWDESQNPIPNICVVLRHGDERLPSPDTDLNGISRLSFTDVDDGEVLQLIIDPISHTVPTLDEPNDFNLQIDPSMYGKTYCFQQSNHSGDSETRFIYTQVNCDPTASATPNPYPGPSDSDRAPSLKPAENVPSATPASPLTFTDGFDYNENSWPIGGSAEVTGSVRDGDVRIDNGALVFNRTFLDSPKLVRTTIPTGRPLKNFAFSASLQSVVQPQDPDDFGRFNFQFRVQDDGRYYNLGINQEGHVSLYYFYREDGLLRHKLIESWPGSDYGFDPAQGAVNTMVVRANESLFSVKFNDSNPFVIEDLMNFIFESGEMSLGIDGSAGNVISYRMDNLVIQEWPGD